jgi:hypothetical protein
LSGKKAAIVGIPIAAVAIALAAVFAFPSQLLPSTDLAGGNEPEFDSVTPANSARCTDLSGRVRTIVSLDAQAMDETRIAAADTLVEQYCQRPELIREIGSMSNPGIGLVAYACDAGSGRIGDSAFQSAAEGNRQIYCDNAFIVIFEESEQMINAAETYIDDLLQESESGDPDGEGSDGGPAANDTASDPADAETRAKLEQISEFAKNAKSLLRADKYYEAAKSLDSASKVSESLSEA